MDQYLILHKVDGRPAFDVAQRLETEEEIWIIPTSGHRAYPWWKTPLGQIVQNDIMQMTELPTDWPEHYQNAKHAKVEQNLDEAFKRLLTPLVNFSRRF